MVELGRILIADDEETFLRSTGDLLRQEGYHCDCVPDALSATKKLKETEYDLLLADIRMPGNPNLEFIHEVPNIAEGMPVILITGYPTRDSAMKAVELPVTAYMIKPICFEELLVKANEAIERSRIFRAVVSAKQRLQHWQTDLVGLEKTLKSKHAGTFSGSIKSFLDLTFGNIAGALFDIKHITDSMNARDVDLAACHLLDCPKLNEITNALSDTIKVLEKTKSAFKSKDLGIIRKKLEEVLRKNRKS